MKNFSIILNRDTKNLFFNPLWVVLGIGYPLFVTLILGFLTQGLYGTKITSYDYYGVTLMVYAALNGATFASNSFLENSVKVPNMRILYAPVKSWMIPLSKGIATFLFTSICYTAVAVFFALFLHIDYGQQNQGLVLLLFLSLDLFCCSLGIFFSCIFKSEEVTNQLISLVLNIFAILSGLFFSVAGLGKTLWKISGYSPITRVVNTTFEMIYDGSTAHFFTSFSLMFGLAVVFFIISGLLFKGEDYV